MTDMSEPKHLFSYTVTPDREDNRRTTDVFDDNAYVVGRISPEVKAEKDRLYDAWMLAHKERKECESKSGCQVQLLSWLLFLLILLVIHLVIECMENIFPDARTELVIFRVAFFIAFLILSKRIDTAIARARRRHHAKKHPDIPLHESELDPALSDAVAAARAELGIPDYAWEMDILPYRHTVPLGGLTEEVRPNKVYDNIPVSVWREGQVLFLSDEDVLLRVPLSEITDLRQVRQRIRFKEWSKADAFDSPTYRSSKINEWISYLTCAGYTELILADGYRLLVPAYDSHILREVLKNTGHPHEVW